MGMRTRNVSTFGYSLSRFSTIACGGKGKSKSWLATFEAWHTKEDCLCDRQIKRKSEQKLAYEFTSVTASCCTRDMGYTQAHTCTTVRICAMFKALLRFYLHKRGAVLPECVITFLLFAK